MPAHVELDVLAVEVGLPDVAQIREPARIFKASREHLGNEQHKYPFIGAGGRRRGLAELDEGPIDATP
jgi:hypothetical protein